MTRKILLIGGGGHCRAAIDVIEATGRYSILGLVEPNLKGSSSVLGYPVIGIDEDLSELLQETKFAIVTVGQIKQANIRQTLFEKLKALDAIIPVIISPRAYVSPHAVLGDGTMVMHGAVINANAQVGMNNIINSLALIEHDVQIGDHCHISTGARLNGGVKIGDRCFIGSGAVVHHNVRIGTGSIVGAGCVVSRDVTVGTN